MAGLGQLSMRTTADSKWGGKPTFFGAQQLWALTLQRRGQALLEYNHVSTVIVADMLTGK